MEAVLDYSRAREGQDKQFTPYPATWFNQERWADDREEWAPTSPDVPTEEAWMMVRDAVRRHGVMGMPEARRAMPADVVDAAEEVGWRNLCDMTEFNSDKLRYNFRVVYERSANGSGNQNTERTREGNDGGVGNLLRVRAGDARVH